VRPYGLGRDEQRLADLLVRVSIRQQPQNLALPLRQRPELLGRLRAREVAGQNGIDVRTAAADELDRAGEIGERRFLEDEAAGAGVEGLGQEGAIAVGGVQNDRRLRSARRGAARDLDPTQLWHPNVDEGDVRLPRLDLLQSLFAVTGARDHLEAFVRQHFGNGLNHCRMVVSDDAGSRQTSLAVWDPPCLIMSGFGVSRHSPEWGMGHVRTGDDASPMHAAAAQADRASEVTAWDRDLLAAGKLAAIGELAGEIAHELNNPLFAILGLVELALVQVEPGTKTHERLELVRETGLEIKELVRTLHGFVREPEELAVAPLQPIVTGALELTRRTSASKGIEIVEDLAAQPILVEAVANQLKQVVLNLLTNARQALPGEGTIAVTLLADDDWATVKVADTGPGVSPDLGERIFEPFFTTKGGSGLGLAAGRTIARLHGGELRLEPSSEGAVFVLTLPRADETDR
jgi:signal transduction histidine kinase